MKKLIFLSIIIFSSYSFSLEDISFACDPKKFLSEDNLTKVLVHRDSAFNICLNCKGESCAFKNELISEEKSLAICKRLFCTASFASRGFEIPPEIPRGRSSFTYHYSISKEGKVIDIKVDKSEGVFSTKDARKFVQALTRKTRFSPINFEGNIYKLTNLSSQMTINTRLGQE